MGQHLTWIGYTTIGDQLRQQDPEAPDVGLDGEPKQGEDHAHVIQCRLFVLRFLGLGFRI